MPDSVSLEGLPIAFDYDCAILDFLRDRMPAEEVLFGRWMPGPKMHAAVVENYEAFTAPYPPLPAIEIGEMQWPTGASRYARALYLVDRWTMLAVAQKAWDYQGELALDEDVPSDWGIEKVQELTLSISGEETFECTMLPLPPYRIPGASTELWLLPLVDSRFLWQQIPYEPPEDMEGNLTWDDLFNRLQDNLGTGGASITWTAIPEEYGIPDPVTIKPGISAAALLDCAALSVNLRPVVDPYLGTVRLLNAASSNARCAATIAKSTIIAGGFRGSAVLPNALAVFCRKSIEFTLSCDQQERIESDIAGGEETFTWLAHSAWIVDSRAVGALNPNLSETQYYVDKLADDMATWFNSGGSYAFAGAIAYNPSGYDDYLTIKTAEVAPKEYTFTSRVYEVPSILLPNLLLSQSTAIKLASQIEQFTADDQESNPLEAYFPGQTTKRVLIGGLTTEHSFKTVTAFYRCGIGWTLLEGGGGGSSELVVFTLTGSLAKTVGATASATAYAPNTIGGSTTTITVTNPGKFYGFSTATGIAAKLSDTLYWVLQLDQPARVRVVLDDNPAHSPGDPASARFGADPRSTNCYFKTASPAPVALSAWPFGFLPAFTGQAPNPLKLMGIAGDIGILEWDNNAADYYLSQVFPAIQDVLWAKVETDRPNGLGQTISCTPVSPCGSGGMPDDPFDVVDEFDVAIHAIQSTLPADRLLVRYDHANEQFVAIQSTHRATRAKALVNGTTFTGTPATFNVDTVLGYDGTITTTLTGVKNRYKWSELPDNSEVELRWDTHLGEWYATQMTCPS